MKRLSDDGTVIGSDEAGRRFFRQPTPRDLQLLRIDDRNQIIVQPSSADLLRRRRRRKTITLQ